MPSTSGRGGNFSSSTGYGVYDFRLQMTLEPETVGTNPPGVVTSPDVKDAYFSINELPLLGRLRVGNFFVPFGLEQVTNDTFNVFLEPAKLNKTGDLLTEKAWVVGGELIEKDAEQFIRERLGLSEQGAAEPCKAEPEKALVKKQ